MYTAAALNSPCRVLTGVLGDSQRAVMPSRLIAALESKGAPCDPVDLDADDLPPLPPLPPVSIEFLSSCGFDCGSEEIDPPEFMKRLIDVLEANQFRINSMVNASSRIGNIEQLVGQEIMIDGAKKKLTELLGYGVHGVVFGLSDRGAVKLELGHSFDYSRMRQDVERMESCEMVIDVWSKQFFKFSEHLLMMLEMPRIVCLMNLVKAGCPKTSVLYSTLSAKQKVIAEKGIALKIRGNCSAAWEEVGDIDRLIWRGVELLQKESEANIKLGGVVMCDMKLDNVGLVVDFVQNEPDQYFLGIRFVHIDGGFSRRVVLRDGKLMLESLPEYDCKPNNYGAYRVHGFEYLTKLEGEGIRKYLKGLFGMMNKDLKMRMSGCRTGEGPIKKQKT